MDLPDCPPGAEGYEDTVVEIARKPADPACTKAEREFQEHIASLKIHVEDGSTRCMAERKGRDVSGKWIYLCYPCAAICSGEGVFQTHISGKKHKNKLGQKNPWPLSIFTEHPYILGEKGEKPNNTHKMDSCTGAVLKKMAEEVETYNKQPSELNDKYNKYRETTCHIQETLDNVKTPLLGLEYLIEHPPEESHHEPSYVCALCTKQGHPRTIVNHLTCYWHRYTYISRHYVKAFRLLNNYRSQAKFREGVNIILSRLAQRVEDKYGRLRPVNIDKEIYDKEKDLIHQWLYNGFHFSEKPEETFEEVVDTDLINSLASDITNLKGTSGYVFGGVNKRNDNRKRDPSPPVVAAPTRPRVPERARRLSPDTLSDISLDDVPAADDRRQTQSTRGHGSQSHRYEPYSKQKQNRSWQDKKKNPEERTEREIQKDIEKRSYKEKLAIEMKEKIELSSKKMLSYHEKNPEKHPLYPEEWKKFWNRRYKEIQAEGKDPSKHDFKPEWIVFWTARMKELHDEEVKVHVNELYRKMCLTPPDMNRRDDKAERRRSPAGRRREPDTRRPGEPLRKRSPDPRRRSPEPRRVPADTRRRSPEPRRRSPEPRRRSPFNHRRSPEHRRPDHRQPIIDYRRDHRSPGRRRSAERRHEPLPRTRSRSPVRPRRSPARTHITLESARSSRSPLSVRAAALQRNRSPGPAPSLQTVLVSDDELRPDDGLSPWNSDKSLDSLGSLPDARSPPRSRSRTASEVERPSRRLPYNRPSDPQDLGPPENIVATLRLLVALEDYLGSIGPKIVDLLTEALKMEKERANSSEDLLVRDTAVVLIETAKEKLKGALQAGLVAAGAGSAVRAAVVRAAATLHAADTRARNKAQEEQKNKDKATAMPVAGVGEVDRAQIAQQMAAALIAQGKTDVSSEELAQLVDAVVGMAEAKKREASEKSRVVEQVAERPRPQLAATGTATALQMLQSAYDENDKRIENDAATDAMDGLSDSDLETLLKNFNELSAEEQHSLIAYLKKLEARSPQRVERLRQYVSAAAGPAPAPAALAPAPPAPADPPSPPPPLNTRDPDLAPVTIESDDDDYTVEEVFKSATEKVKENQIRQEMEIIKKSLEESTKPPTPEVVEKAKHSPALKEVIPTVDLTANFSSATNLLALVQASIQSTSASSETADVVSSSSQPRSFGDRSESASTQPPQQFGNQQGLQMNFQSRSQDSYDQSQGNWQDNRQFMPDNRGPMQDNRGPPMQDNRGPPMQDNRGPLMQDNRGPPMQDNRGPPMQDNRGPLMQDNRGPPMQDNRGPPMQENRGPMQGQGPMQGGHGHMQGSQGYLHGGQGSMLGGQGSMHGSQGSMHGGQGTTQGVQGPMQDNRGMMQDNRPPYMQENRPFTQDNRSQNMQNRPPPFMSGPNVRLQGQGYDNFGSDSYNQGPRSNFMNGRMQDNYDTRPMNMNQQNNFRGRGRGHFSGPMRGRGRGYY